jgi:urease accessory protein
MNLRLLQLGDSALPIGGYSHSWGLEAGIDRGLVRDPESLERWTRNWLRHAVAPFEGVVVAAVSRAVRDDNWQEVVRANELLWCSLTPPTLRHASRDMGQQLIALARDWPWSAALLEEFFGAVASLGFPPPLWGRVRVGGESQRSSPSPQPSPIEGKGDPAPRSSIEWHHAVTFAILATAAGAQAEEALAVYLHQAALGAISAGVRAIPIGHTHGQQVLARIQDEIEALAREFATRDLDMAGSFCPAYEMLCHAQSHLYTRLFRS